MNKEAALIMGVITAVLTLLNFTLVPEQYEAVSFIVEAFVLAGGFGAVRQFVYSRQTVRKFLEGSQEPENLWRPPRR